jgi:tripeptide aminopeptidase
VSGEPGPLQTGAVSLLGSSERRYLNDTFAALCAIESPSLRERACAGRVREELATLGIEATEDDAGAAIGSDSGNLLARIEADPGATEGSGGLLLCAHLDTVPLLAPVEPVVREGMWENANEGVLGADNKAAVAMLLALARHLRREGSPIDIELLFTVGEEISLAGARAFDVSRLRSSFGYVFDHATPIGEVIVGSPTHFRLEATFRGAAAHAGIRPEDGRSAIAAAARAIASMRLGRIDERTTANIGTIAGGTALNVVPEACSIVGEVRSLDDAAAEELVAAIVDRIHEAGNEPDCDCDVDVKVERTFTGYELAPSSEPVRAAERALSACGYQPVHATSGGGSDANALIAAGLPVVNLANGTERNHEPGERVSVAALEGMLDVVLALVHEVATPSVEDRR